MHPAERHSHAAVPEWHSRGAVACKRLDRIVRLPMSWQVAEQRIDVRAVSVAAVERVRQHLADDLLMLRRVGRSRTLLLAAVTGCKELMGRGHDNRVRG